MQWKLDLKRLWSSLTQRHGHGSDQANDSECKDQGQQSVDRNDSAKICSPANDSDKASKRNASGDHTKIPKGADTSELEYQDWYLTQFQNLTADAARVRVIIGLDFGTSYTKVVLGESRIRYPIPIHHEARSMSDYLFPGVLNIDDDGVCRIADQQPSALFLNSLKIPLLQRDFSDEAKSHAAAYLALVLRHVRGWLMNEKSAVYRDKRLEWFINIGLPTEDALDDDLTQVYRNIVQTAWTLSAEESPVRLDRAIALQALETRGSDILDRNGNDGRYLHPEAVLAFPEFAAGVAAYVNSPVKTNGLHAMIDIGAGTLDVTLFNIVDEDGEYRYPILAKLVAPLGTEFLTRHRLNGSSNSTAWEHKPQDPIPSDKDMAALLGLTLQELHEVDNSFKREVRLAVGDQFSYTKKHRYPNSPAWKKGLPVFVFGGGANCEFFKDALSTIVGKNSAWYAMRASLPRPDDLDGGVDNDWMRLAVAYGLSLDPGEIGELIRPENIEDMRPAQPLSERFRENYIDKDMV